MKKYPSGFVPANFQKVGLVIFVVGILCIFAKLLDVLIVSINLPTLVLYFGVGCLIVAGYLIFVVPKED